MLPITTLRLRRHEPVRIVAFGDSISEVGRSPRWHGGASRPAFNWARRLSGLLKQELPGADIRVFNRGVGGENAEEGLARVDSLRRLKPTLVLVEFGTNDCVHHFLEPEATETALTLLCRELHWDFGADTVLLGTAGDNPLRPTFRHRDETIAATARAAVVAGRPFVDMRAAILAATNNGERWTDYHVDEENCHPNDLGHEVWARAVMGVLLPALAASHNWRHAP